MLLRPIAARAPRRARRLPPILALLTAGALAAPAGAQYSGVVSPSETGEIPSRAEMEQRAEEARWRLGILRLQPWFGIRDASFVSGSETDGEDFTASGGAGLRGYVRAGDHVVVAAHALPEYTWWAEASERSGLDGRLGVGLFTYFNRLTTEASVRSSELQELFSPESEELAVQTARTGRLALELALTAKIALAATLTRTERELDEGPATFAALDRDEERSHLALVYRPREEWRLQLGFLSGSDEFAPDARALSNDFDEVLLDAAFDGNRFGASAGVGRRTIQATAGSVVAEDDVTTFAASVSVRPTRGPALSALWQRRLAYALAADTGTILSERLLLEATSSVGPVEVRLNAQTGEDEYRALGGDAVARTDDVTGYGGQLGFTFRDLVSLAIGVQRLEYDDGLGGERDVTVVATSFQLGRVPARLQGRGVGGDW